MNVYDLINADFANITSRVTVVAATDDTPAVGFIVVGTDSPQYLAEADRQRAEGQAYRRAANKDATLKIDTDTDEGQAKFQKRVDANLLGSAAACTVGWFGFTQKSDVDGKPVAVPFDQAILTQMLVKKKSWRDAIIKALDEDARFLPQPAKN